MSGDIHHPVVAVPGKNAKLLRAADINLPFARLNADTANMGRILRTKGHAGRHPAANGFVLGGAGADARSAAVRGLPGHLPQEQARLGSRRQHTPAARLRNQAGMVGGGIETEHRELEPVLSLRLAVAARAVALKSAQKRHNIVDEVILRGTDEPLMRTATSLVCPSICTTTTVLPSETAVMMPRSLTRATAGLREV